MTPRRRIIPVFVPHLGCPHDCVFCNQRRISGEQSPATAETVYRAAEEYYSWASPDVPAELAFYGGSFTAIAAQQQEELLQAAQDFLRRNPENALRVSTRPDCINDEILLRLKRYGVKTIELGCQSMDSEVLELTNRGHSADDVKIAASLIKNAGFTMILQMMTGLPGDTVEKSIHTARELIALYPDGVRIYPTVIVKDTALHDMFINGQYCEHTVNDAVELCAQLVPLFENAEVPIIRLGLNPSEELSNGSAVGGAYHPALGEMVYSRIFLNNAREKMLSIKPRKDEYTILVPKGKTSMMVGQKRCNILILCKEFGLKKLTVKEDEKLSGRQIYID